MDAIGVGGERLRGRRRRCPRCCRTTRSSATRSRGRGAAPGPRPPDRTRARSPGSMVVDVVAALGDGQRDDPGARRGQQFDHRLGIVGGVAVVDDRPDHPRVAAAVGVLEQQRVQAVLGGQHLGHLAVGRHDADAADAPVAWRAPSPAGGRRTSPGAHGGSRRPRNALCRYRSRRGRRSACRSGSRANVELFSFMTPPPPS